MGTFMLIEYKIGLIYITGRSRFSLQKDSASDFRQLAEYMGDGTR